KSSSPKSKGGTSGGAAPTVPTPTPKPLTLKTGHEKRTSIGGGESPTTQKIFTEKVVERAPEGTPKGKTTPPKLLTGDQFARELEKFVATRSPSPSRSPSPTRTASPTPSASPLSSSSPVIPPIVSPRSPSPTPAATSASKVQKVAQQSAGPSPGLTE